jgi:hypothetical protein
MNHQLRDSPPAFLLQIATQGAPSADRMSHISTSHAIQKTSSETVHSLLSNIRISPLSLGALGVTMLAVISRSMATHLPSFWMQ